jgi:hypothetical protein
MTRAAWLLAWRSLADRPARAALLLAGYGVGVAVMIALLSVGQALLTEARDPNLAAGGDLVLLPQGIDPSVLAVNGVTGMYLTIPHAAFVVQDILGGPRVGRLVAAAAPELRERQIYIRGPRGTTLAYASAGVPSLDRAVGVPDAVPGASDTASDRAWMNPASDARFNEIDRFHTPRGAADTAWAEWDYFNFLDPASGTYGYLTLLAAANGRGAVLFRLRRPGRPVEDISIPASLDHDGVSTTGASQRIGPSRVWVDSGVYHITVRDPRLRVDLTVTPVPGQYLPPVETEDRALISGYVVPALGASVSGTIRTADAFVRLAGAQGYHDHNWGTWRGVTWDWGEAFGSGGALLYGAVYSHGAGDSGLRPAAMFLWGPAGAGRRGFAGVFEIKHVEYTGWHPGPVLDGRPVSVPGAIVLEGASGPDTLRVRIRVWDALASRPPAASSGRGAVPVFLQLRTIGEVSGTVGGRPVRWSGQGASETYVPLGRRSAAPR